MSINNELPYKEFVKTINHLVLLHKQEANVHTQYSLYKEIYSLLLSNKRNKSIYLNTIEQKLRNGHEELININHIYKVILGLEDEE